MPNAAKWRFRGPSQSPISSRVDSFVVPSAGREGGRARSFFSVNSYRRYNGRGRRGRRRLDRRGGKKERESERKGKRERNGCSLSHLLSPRITTWTGRKYFAARATSTTTTTSLNFPQHSSFFLLSIRVRKGKTQLPPFDACMHPNRKVEQERWSSELHTTANSLHRSEKFQYPK